MTANSALLITIPSEIRALRCSLLFVNARLKAAAQRIFTTPMAPCKDRVTDIGPAEVCPKSHNKAACPIIFTPLGALRRCAIHSTSHRSGVGRMKPLARRGWKYQYESTENRGRCNCGRDGHPGAAALAWPSHRDSHVGDPGACRARYRLSAEHRRLRAPRPVAVTPCHRDRHQVDGPRGSRRQQPADDQPRQGGDEPVEPVVRASAD